MTLGDLLRQHASDPDQAERVYLYFEDRTWTFAQTYREACRYANLFVARLDPARPRHVGLLLENRPEFVFGELGAALAGAVEVLHRHPDVFMCAVYGVPDAEAGDRVMVALALREDAPFDPEGFARFLDAQSDLSPKWRPTYVRVVPELRRSETNKVLKRELQREKFLDVDGSDPLWWQPRGEATYRRMTARDLTSLRTQFERAGNLRRLTP